MEEVNVHSDGTLTIDAVGEQDIDAKVDAIAVSFAASAGQPLAQTSLSLAGWVTSLFGLIDATPESTGISAAGVYSVNRLNSDISADIDGNGDQGINADGVELHAKDNSTITSESLAAAVGVALSLGEASIFNIGAGYATNLVDTNSSAHIVNVTDIDTDGGAVVVSASDSREIIANATAATVAVGLGTGDAFTLNASGGYVKNRILGSTIAHVSDSTIGKGSDAVGALDVHASSTSFIDAPHLRGQFVGCREQFGRNRIGLGFNWAENQIGVDDDKLKVAAYVSNSVVHAQGDFTVDAVGGQDINADYCCQCDGDCREWRWDGLLRGLRAFWPSTK